MVCIVEEVNHHDSELTLFVAIPVVSTSYFLSTEIPGRKSFRDGKGLSGFYHHNGLLTSGHGDLPVS